MHYRKIWEKYHNKKIPKGCEIHHVDGNKHNNNVKNLLCVSIKKHLEIHKKQKDWGAVQAIFLRMNNLKELKIAASNFQKQKIKQNKHNFQFISKKRRKEISKKTIKKRIIKFGVAFLGIEDNIKNGKKGGIISAKRKSGFLNVNSYFHGSKHVKNTFWWTHIPTGKRIRCKIPPNKEWVIGMKKQNEKND